MNNIEVTLREHFGLYHCSDAIRTCWDSHDKSDHAEKDQELINRVGNIYKHSSTLEHLVYGFQIKGISRSCLQELARHRIASLSVKSTRYTLSRLKTDQITEFNYSDYCVVSQIPEVNEHNLLTLKKLQELLNKSYTNDQVKYLLPEAFRTQLSWTINARSLQNFLKLRTSRAAHFEIQHLAYLLYEAIPQDHKYIFNKCLNLDT